MKQETIIEIALAFEMLKVCQRIPEDRTHDDVGVDEQHREHVGFVCTTMCNLVDYPTIDQRIATRSRLITFVMNNMANHDDDDSTAMIDDMCNIINPEEATR